MYSSYSFTTSALDGVRGQSLPSRALPQGEINTLYWTYTNNNILIYAQCEPGSSVSVVSGYGLYDRAIEVRSSAEAEFYSSLCVQTGFGAHPASCTMGNGCPFSGCKARPGREAYHSPTSSAEVKNE
jgi:hypothetical protein